jgi:phage terminase large subunit-like protein
MNLPSSSPKDYSGIARQYALEVVAATIPACKWVRLTCQRHLDDLAKSGDQTSTYCFDEAKANRACRFIERLPHTKGRWAAKRQRLTLQPWQIFIVTNLFGWVFRDSGLRKYRQAFLLIPRKNGKSPLAAAIGIYMLAADGEAGAEVYCGASSEKQAWEVFRPAKLMAERTPQMCDALGVRVNAKSLVTEDASRFEPVIGKPGDGASVSCGIADEFHEADDAVLYDTFLTGMVGREQPLLLVITTAGYNIASPCHALQVDAQKVLEGTLQDEQLFAAIYTIDDGDDWTSEEALIKANPNYNVSVNAKTLLHDQQIAIQNASKQNTFKTKHLNIWCNANSAWLNAAAWKAGEDLELKIEDFIGDPCYIGLDLMNEIDLAAAVKVFVRVVDGKQHYYVFCRHYLPEDQINRVENQHYQRWRCEKTLTACDGASLDYAKVENDLIADINNFQVREVCFDKMYCAPSVQRVQMETQVSAVEVLTKTPYMSPAMKALEAAILDGRVHHPGDPILDWAMSNVVAHVEGPNETVFPRKEKPQLKIDPAVALLTAFYRAMSLRSQGASDPGCGIMFA